MALTAHKDPRERKVIRVMWDPRDRPEPMV
jgi:hypothetical protein